MGLDICRKLSEGFGSICMHRVHTWVCSATTCIGGTSVAMATDIDRKSSEG